MPETCYVCEYKRVARETLHDFLVLARCLGALDFEIRDAWLRIVDAHRQDFLAIHTKQREETDEASRRAVQCVR